MREEVRLSQGLAVLELNVMAAGTGREEDYWSQLGVEFYNRQCFQSINQSNNCMYIMPNILLIFRSLDLLDTWGTFRS